MPLVPADVHDVAFSKPPIGKRGLPRRRGGRFLDLVETELTRLIEENNDLRSQIDQVDQQQRPAPLDPAGALRPPELPRPAMAPVPPPTQEQTSPGGGDHNVQAAKILDLAQEMADRLTGEAKADADGMLSEARTRPEQLLFEARAKADGMVTQARTRAETMPTDARTKAETLDRQSRENAASLERNAAGKHTEIIAALSQDKTALEKRIDEMRTLEREYRNSLKTYLTSELKSWAGTDPPHQQTRWVPGRTG